MSPGHDGSSEGGRHVSALILRHLHPTSLGSSTGTSLIEKGLWSSGGASAPALTKTSAGKYFAASVSLLLVSGMGTSPSFCLMHVNRPSNQTL